MQGCKVRSGSRTAGNPVFRIGFEGKIALRYLHKGHREKLYHESDGDYPEKSVGICVFCCLIRFFSTATSSRLR